MLQPMSSRLLVAVVALSSVVSVCAQERASGTLQKQDVGDVVQRHIGALQSCYERALLHDPDLGGRLVMEWTITTEGVIGDVSVRTDEVGDPAVAACVTAIIEGFTFEGTPDEDITITYPFMFRAVDSDGGLTPEQRAGLSAVELATTEDLYAYGQACKDAIVVHWHMPATTPADAGAVAEVELRLDAAGTILGLKLVTPSGDEAYDASVIEAIRATEEFPPPPRTVVEALHQGLVLRFVQP
jgi:TonB family protein